MARIKRSARDLWSLVTSSPVLNSKDLILYELEENGDRILNGILFISKFNQTSLDALKKSAEDAHFEFISKLSKLIDVDSMQCYELFISYATYEYKGTQKTLEAQLLSERHMQSLLTEVWQYYFGERLYYLLILKHILSHWQDEADPNKEIYEKFLDKINKDKAVLHKIINQIEVSISTELPSKDTNGPYMTDLLAYHWVTFILKEQCELLQLLLLYYKVIEPTISDVQKLISLFQTHGFGLRQSFRFMFSDENQHLVDLIGYLEGFVLIQCFEMELLFKFKETGMLGEHYLLKDEKALLELNNSIHNLGSHQSHSPVLLCWLLISQCSEVPEMVKCAKKLGKTALQLDVFEYLKTAVSSPDFSRKGVIPDTVNSIAYNLLSIVLSQFELQHLGSVQPLYSIATCVLKCKSVADDFWEQEEKSGIRELFNYCIEMFSIEFCPLLNMCSSLASVEKESCVKVVQTIKKLPVFTEFLENIDERDVIATQEPNIWELIKDRTLYGDHSITLPKGTLGIVIKETDKDSSSVIQWQVDVNGWQICLRELYFKLQEMSFSSALIPVESIKRMITVGKLVKNILETAPEMRFQLSHILNAMFSILQRHISSTSPSLELISVCIDIAAILSRDEVSDVWQQLSQIRLLPFMTSIPKNLIDRVSGICMNIGIIGQLIASRECISGEYSVCLAFLNLVLNVSKNSTSENENFQACVVYIMREIFSYFHKWYYSEPNQRLLMGQKCLQLLHNLFPMDKHKIKSLGEAQELCIYSLLNFEAGQTLLKIVCTGEEVVQQTVLKQNSELGEEVASMIRLSLSVLNRLLLLRNNFCVKSSKTEVSPLEAVLFSTPGHTTQPQVVLMVAHYAFQRYNPHLAILAIQLLKRFAKEFPMSLLACFGSEAEAIRDHFLARLCFQYENVRLKVAILEFLTVCIAQQPGLIEMFINVSQKSNEPSKEEVKQKSCLECVKGILKEKESEDPYPQELLCAAVEFIHALWAGHQALAMEALKQDPQFWNLICGVLFTDKYFIQSAGINAYVIRTLTLEVFYKAATRKGLDEHVKAVFNDIHSKNFLLQWSKHVHSSSPKSDFQVQILSSMSDDVTDTFALLTAWRDFLLILAVYKPLQLSSDAKEQILANILDHFSKEIAKNNSRSLILLSELFLMLGSHWKSEFVKLVNSEDNNSIFNILNEVAQEVNVVHPREQLVVVSIAVFTLRMLSNSNIKLSKIKDWIVPCCQLLKKASVLVHQPLDPKAISGVLKLPIVIICLLNELIQESTGWLPVLKSCSVFPVLVSLLIKSLKLDDGMDLSHSIFTLFLTMASEKQAAETLCSSGFMPEVTLMLSETNLKNPVLERKTILVNLKKKVSKQDVYFAHLRFITVLLQTLGNYFLQDCWNFTGVHQEILHEGLISTRSSLSLENIQHAILTASFIHQLSFHQQMWKLEQPKTLQMLLMDICNCIYSTVAILSKPGLLKYLVMHKKMPDSKLSPTKSLDAEGVLRKGPLENESESSRDVLEVEQKLFELLCTTLTVLKKYTPDIAETMSGYTIDYGQWQLFLNVNFSIPSVDQVGPISFGTILACVNMCLKVLAKNEKTPSPRKSTESSPPVNRSFLMYILEVSLTILLSQSKVAFSHPELPLREKQLIKRELSAELNSMNITINRFLRRGPLSPAVGRSSTSPVFSRSQSTEFSFLKMISNLVEKLFK